jgi:hypothetical protein
MYKTIEGDQYIKEGYGRYIVFCNLFLASDWGSSEVSAIWEKRVVYHLHGMPIRFEIVLMVSKISDRKSHSDYALSI